MSKILQNTKAQFFIATAVIIILSISIIFFYLSTVSYSPDISVKESDIAFFANNIKEEFGKTVELTLSNVSGYLGQVPVKVTPSDALDKNISNFSRYAIAYASQKGILLNVSYSIVTASNTTMNVSVDLIFKSENAIYNTSFLAYKDMHVDALNGSLSNQLGGARGGEGCSFNVTVRKEYNETQTNISNLVGSNFVFLINGSACVSPTYSEGSPGKYNFTCTSSGCAGSTVVANVTDLRNIIGWSTLPNTGSTDVSPPAPSPGPPNYGCAATCGQALD